MSLTPFFQAPIEVQIHAISALEALLIGPFLLYRRRRDRLHKILGYAWVTNMAVAALSSFALYGLRWFGPFGPIHVLSVTALATLWMAIRHARTGNIKAHRQIMHWLCWGGLVTAGVLTLLPGRMVHRMLFGGDIDALVWMPALAAGTLTIWLVLRSRTRLPWTQPGKW